MAEEKKIDDALKDDALSEKKVEGEKTEFKEGEKGEKKDEKDQRLESALGRITGMQGKVDSMESRFSGLDGKLDTILSTVSNPPRTEELDYTQDADYMPTTQAELDAWYDKRRTADIKVDQDYSTGYMSQLGELAKGEEKEVHDAIVKEMMDNFNVRHSDNGLMDADLNYSKASRAHFKKQLDLKDKTNPLNGPDKDKPPLGGGLGGEEMIEQPETSMPKLDDAAADFVKSSGMSEEKVRAALKGDTPLSLRQNEKIG